MTDNVPPGGFQLDNFVQNPINPNVSMHASNPEHIETDGEQQPVNPNIFSIPNPTYYVPPVPPPPPPPSAPSEISQLVAGLSALVKQMSEKKDPKGAPKFKEPALFDGKSSKVTEFVQDMKNAIWLSRNVLPTPYDECIYFSTFLGQGSPREWWKAVLLSKKNLLESTDDLIRDFEQHFGDSDIATTAQRKLDALWQTGSAASYFSRFNEWVVHLTLTKTSKINLAKRHLKDPVKDALALVRKKDRPTEFKAFCDLVIELDKERDVKHRE